MDEVVDSLTVGNAGRSSLTSEGESAEITSEPVGASAAMNGNSGQRIVALRAIGPTRATPGIKFLDLTFDATTLAEASRLVVERSKSPLPFVYVVTPNVDHRVRLQRQPDLKRLYDSAWMTLCDSRIFEMLARLDGLDLRAAPGADLVEHLFENEIAEDTPINVIGTSEDVIASLRARYGLRRLNWHRPPMDLSNKPEEIAAAAAFVVENPADITFICVGSPQQELVARAIIERGGAKGVGLCCGASLEFLTGKVSRAPRWMRQLALEWLHRLISDPFRMSRRYLIDGPVIFPIWLGSHRKRRTNPEGKGAGNASAANSVHSISVPPAA